MGGTYGKVGLNDNENVDTDQPEGPLLSEALDEDEVPHPKYMIRQASNLRTRWDLFVMGLAVYNSFSIPIMVAFQPPAGEMPAIVALDFIIDMLFMADIALIFRTTFYHPKTGIEIWDPKEIARRYIKGGRFFIDFLSSFPFDFIAGLAGDSSGSLAIFGILKLLRIFRLSNIIMYMRTTESVKGSLKLMQLLLYLYIYVNVFA